MQIDRIRRNVSYDFSTDHHLVDRMRRDRENNWETMSSGLLLMPSSPPPPNSSSGAVNFIEHQVSKLDTLAGVAIKYGVEVADIKRMNNLVTDLQMFALKSLQIPLPGRHPPSATLSNGSPTSGDRSSQETPSRPAHVDIFESFQSLRLKPDPPRISSAMSSLQGFYGLKPLNLKEDSNGTEMSVYRTGKSHYLEDQPPGRPSSSQHRKTRSLVSSILNENTNLAEDVPTSETRNGDSQKSNEKFIRWRQKSDADNSPHTPETLLKVDNGGSGFSATAGKGLALRPKSYNRLAQAMDSDSSWLNPVSAGDSVLANGFSGVRKSSSTSCLQEQDSNGSSFMWTTSKRTSQTTTSNRLIFDGLPKPVTGRRNKAALD